MTDEIIQPATDVTVVNRRVPVPESALEELRRLYGVALETRRVADLVLRQTMLTMGVDPERAAFDPDSGEIVLDEVDHDRLQEGIQAFLDGAGATDDT